MKTWSVVICIFIFTFFALPIEASARVWINEFSSNGSDDWIEVYNDAAQPINLELYRLRDSSATNKLDMSGQIEPGGYAVFDWGTKLNNSGDTIKLVSASDENTVIDEIVYGNSEDIAAPAAGQSAGRQADGGSPLVVFANPSKNAPNADVQTIPTATVIPEKVPTPTKIPTPTKTPTPKKISPPTKSPTTKPLSVTVSHDDEESENSTATIKSLQTGNAKVPKISGVPTSILGVASKAATPKPKAQVTRTDEKVMVKSAVAPPYLMIVSGTVFCIACGILVFLKRRNTKHES